MMQLGAQLQAANETKNEQEQSSTYKEECEKELEGVEERIERNESRVSTHFLYVTVLIGIFIFIYITF